MSQVRCECCGWEMVELDEEMCDSCEQQMAQAVEKGRDE